jgi:hypothetical protein
VADRRGLEKGRKTVPGETTPQASSRQSSPAIRGAGLTLSARNLMDEERPTHLPIRSYVAIGVRDTG